MIRRTLLILGLLAALLLVALAVYIRQPLGTSRLDSTANVVLDQQGERLATRLSVDGFWREPVSLEEIDPRLIEMLVAYEDKRFWQHPGVDLLAVLRAMSTMLHHGRVVSGASTLTMQTVRLMYPELGRKTLGAKLEQMLMALRLEHHWSKRQILEAYFNLAPYGGNIEGIRAASFAWLNRSPLHLTYREAAFFVALPQSPESRRPDRHREAAERATSRVLQDVAESFGWSQQQLEEYQAELIPLRKQGFSTGDAHLIDRLGSASGGIVRTHIDGEWQARAREILRGAIASHGSAYNAAVMVVERRTGRVKTYLASSGYANAERKGANNFLLALRSPGSTLKPMIYGMALQRGLLEPQSSMLDTEIQVEGYAPTNFDDGFHGRVRLKEALIQSLNIPAINTLERLGPQNVERRLRQYLSIPRTQAQGAGLSLAVGGFYMTAEQLATLYLGMLDQPAPRLSFLSDANEQYSEGILSNQASDQLVSLLSQRDNRGLPYVVKTGTSDGRNDAWSIHVTQRHLVLVWVGSPDHLSGEQISGAQTASPIGRELILALGLEPPLIPEIAVQERPLVAKANCNRLIEYPEPDELILTQNGRIAVASRNTGVSWYLNGKAVEVENGTLPLEHAGANVISARYGSCDQAQSIFVQFVN
ncbi:penicillin-binding protein 1C [Marinobacterium mangrovicola]|uniref:peptidoglycan glycosyltransferase n=1 Tax=Marinobacterium mangrovicola TaxID=1476959 RepID=A0A4V2PEA5_9GAMM|nr:penicillin-binding protein 1C [Marinobacterium mangrovicola]TCK08366.1 penicillin-binding protein 1C [Marinobacterium mangrovicola]